MGNSAKYVANSFIWSTISKILNAGLRFVSIPLLLNYFGKDSYGLITLAVSINAYMQLMDMGMNTGAINFFSKWIAGREYNRLNRVARTNLSFYIILGVINSVILLFFAWQGEGIFNITPNEFQVFRSLLYVLAGVSIINWSTFVFNQLLVADEQMVFTQQVMTVRSILNIGTVLLAIDMKWSVVQYFLIDSICNMLVIIPYYVLTKKKGLIKSLLPAFYWKEFSVVFKYSMAIFAMSIFQFTATQSRPLIIGMFGNNAVSSILAEYRIVEVFPLFILSIGGSIIPILLPKTSRAVQQDDRIAIEKVAYEGTKYTSILVTFLCFPIILNAGELLTLYVGSSYHHLAIWLSLWVFTLTLFLHNTPVSSLVLATGKTRMLVYSSAISCIVSIVINAILTSTLGVGSAVIGYLVYIIIQISFYYFYFNTKVLKLNSMQVFKSFFIPTGIGFILFLIISNLKVTINSLLLQIIVNSVLWIGAYLLFLYVFKVVDVNKILKMMRND
jgi:O-antigen/teichoic acid export membrane protein